MTITMTLMLVTAIILACASLMLNVYQWAERKNERKELAKLISKGARLEDKVNDLQTKYDNEVLHKNWAIGRIKDQQAVIDQLKSNIMSKKAYKTRKETSHD